MRGVYSNHKKGRDGMNAEIDIEKARTVRNLAELAVKSYANENATEGENYLRAMRELLDKLFTVDPEQEEPPKIPPQE